MTMPVAPERMTLEQIVARADSLHRAYRFRDALELYLLAGEAARRPGPRTALNLMDLCAKPHVVARQRFSRKDFFLYYPLPQHAWHPSPNQLDSSEFYPVYYPKGADAIYYSARDRAGTRSLFVTEDLDSIWRAPRLLGESLLSIGTEIFPMLSPDGQTLYFASDGLFGVGGFDLYMSRWDADAGRWGAPVNMGFPFNSPSDDFLLCDTQDGKYTLFASNRECAADSVYVYVLDRASLQKREAVRDAAELAGIAALRAVQDPSRMDAASAMSSESRRKTPIRACTPAKWKKRGSCATPFRRPMSGRAGFAAEPAGGGEPGNPPGGAEFPAERRGGPGGGQGGGGRLAQLYLCPERHGRPFQDESGPSSVPRRLPRGARGPIRPGQHPAPGHRVPDRTVHLAPARLAGRPPRPVPGV